jgi:hypothetical protein
MMLGVDAHSGCRRRTVAAFLRRLQFLQSVGCYMSTAALTLHSAVAPGGQEPHVLDRDYIGDLNAHQTFSPLP